MSMWRRRHGPDDNYGITVGQRFSTAGRAQAVWEVITVAHIPAISGPMCGSPGSVRSMTVRPSRSRFCATDASISRPNSVSTEG